MRMRRTPLPLLLLFAASCAPRTGQLARGSGGDTVPAAEAGPPVLGIDLSEGKTAGASPGADSRAPGLGIDLTEGKAWARPPGEAVADQASRSPAAAPARATAESVVPGAPSPSAPVPDVAHAELAAPEFATAVAASPIAGAGSRGRLVGGARRFVGRPFKGDCTGFVRRVLDDAQVSLPRLGAARTMTESLYRSLPHVRRPQPGDLAFFHATRTRDRPGSAQSRFTHVAVVEKVEGSRVTLIHRGSRGIRRFVMNLERPHDRRENAMVRRRRVQDAPGTRYLAAELFGGYATALGTKTTAGGRGASSAARAATDEVAGRIRQRAATASRR